jgi:arylsulfatase A-like enzyme
MLNIQFAVSFFLAAAAVTGHCLFAAERPPNIVFILADDLGWSELGCYGNNYNETPNLDRLAKQGMRFTQAYAAAPVCSPYRASFLTGQYPVRHGLLDYLRPDSDRPLSADHITLAEMLKRAGYATGMIGKWHLSGYRYHNAPVELRATDHGFDEEIASEIKGVGNGANFWPYVFRTQPVRWLNIEKNRLGDNEYLVDRMNLEAVEFIERHKAKPFFLYLSHYAPHTILNGRPDLVDKFCKKHAPGRSTRERCYLCQDAGHKGDPLNHWASDHNPHLAAMLASIDEGAGQILKKLDELKLAEDTIVIFTSDNGGETNVTSNAPLRGGKSQLYEGGIRVPLVVRWPKGVPAAVSCQQPTVNVDFYPTLLDAVGVKLDERQQIDGISILETLGGGRPSSRDAIYWHYPLAKPHFLGGRSSGAIRDGDWKLIESYETGDVELFNLANDTGESKNLSSAQPKKAVELRSRLKSWRRQLGVESSMDMWLCRRLRLRFQDSFSPVSSRWFFQKHWNVAGGALVRNDIAGTNQRIFVKKPTFRNAVIEVDFSFRGAGEIRIMTGTPGKYNAVVHIWPNGFRMATARDETVPFYPTIHGECTADFKPNTWHTMTIEIHGDEIVARTSDKHFVVGRHPIVDRGRDYFALQVDRPGAAFDNVRVWDAEPKRNDKWPQTRARLLAAQKDRAWLLREPAERFRNLTMITRDRLYRTDAKYRELVKQIDQCKAEERERFPDVFRTVKQRKKELLALRKSLLSGDAEFKKLHDAVSRTRRSESEWLHEKQPALGELPPHAYPAALERARLKFEKAPEYSELVARRRLLEVQQRKRYPEVFRKNEDFLADSRAARQRRNELPEFRALLKRTAAAVSDEREYLFAHEPELKELDARMKSDN